MCQNKIYKFNYEKKEHCYKANTFYSDKKCWMQKFINSTTVHTNPKSPKNGQKNFFKLSGGKKSKIGLKLL